MSKDGGSFPKGRQKYEIEDKSFSKYDRNLEPGEIDKRGLHDPRRRTE